MTFLQTFLTALRFVDFLAVAIAMTAIGICGRLLDGARSILSPMAATPTPEGIPQRLAAIRAQMSLLADYL